jgi:hypothetical protein
MRATGCLCALLGALLALPAAGAHADIKPLPKPAVVSSAPAPGNRGSLIAPVSKPVVPPTVKPAGPQVTATTRVTATATRRHAVAPAMSLGGREQPQLAGSGGGRAAPALPPVAVLAPTPLGMVGADEPLPVLGDAWPPWMFALLTLLAFAEAGVLTHLVRSSPARAGRA